MEGNETFLMALIVVSSTATVITAIRTCWDKSK